MPGCVASPRDPCQGRADVDYELKDKVIDEWLERSETAELKVPSALVTEEWNYLLNPLKRTF
jgi:RES domain-containing protein